MRVHQFEMRKTVFGLLVGASLASAHSWVEQLMAIAPNGSLVGAPGFPRGNVLRTSPTFSDPTMVNLIPPGDRVINEIHPSDLMCKVSQVTQTQTEGSPRLQAIPGAAVALRFQENGHVTLPDTQPGKPANRGTVYVYGTTQPSPDDSFLAIHRQWTPDGKGGDGRGVLLSTRNFDDGQCYQVNGGPASHQRQAQYPHAFNMYMGNDLWCQQDIQLPADIPVGRPYTLYWVWDWPTMPGTPGFLEGKQELYTTCIDIDIVAGTEVQIFNKALGAPQWAGPSVDNGAIQAQFDDIANPTAVTGAIIPFAASATGPVPGAASEASVSQATQTSTDEAFLTVHTGSTAGFGVETQTFSFQPIGESGVPQAGNQAPQITGAPGANVQAAIITVTEYTDITETVFETVWETTYQKRSAGPVITPAPVLDSPAGQRRSEHVSTAHPAFRLRARNPFIWLGWANDDSMPGPPTPSIHL